MGTIAARDCLRVLQLTEQVAAASLLAGWQGLKLRLKQDELNQETFSTDVQAMIDDIDSFFTMVTEDRPLESELRNAVTQIQEKRWDLYE